MLRRWLGDGTFWRQILRLGLPIAVQNLLMSSFSLVDTIMVGQLGEVALAGVGMAGQWSWLMNLVMFGISSGAAVFISQYWGMRDIPGIHKAYGVMMVSSLACALPFALVALIAPEWVVGFFTVDERVIAEGASYLRLAAISYLGIAVNNAGSMTLRATENVKLPMWASAVSVAANAALNAVLIFGLLGFPKLGVRGAAIATAISAWVSPAITYLISWKRKNIIIAPLKRIFSFNKEFVWSFYKRALPVVCNETLWALGTVFLQRIFGMMGTEYYSALTIFRSIDGIVFAFYVGICHACTIAVGKRVGAGDFDEAALDANRFALLVPLLAACIGTIVILLRGSIVQMFDVSAAVAQNAMNIMLVYGIETAIRNIPYICIVGIFRAGGDTRTGMYYDLGCLWALSVPITYICANILHLPFILVYVIMLLAEDIPKAILCMYRLKSRKWIMPVSLSSESQS